MYMLQYVTITSQGQVSIPADLRRKLGFEKTRKATIRADGDALILEPVKDILELQGVFKTKKRIPWRVIRKGLDDAWAQGKI